MILLTVLFAILSAVLILAQARTEALRRISPPRGAAGATGTSVWYIHELAGR